MYRLPLLLLAIALTACSAMETRFEATQTVMGDADYPAQLFANTEKSEAATELLSGTRRSGCSSVLSRVRLFLESALCFNTPYPTSRERSLEHEGSCWTG